MSKRTTINPTAKLLVFDLETANLDANRGHIICAAAKWVGSKPVYTWRIDETEGYGESPASYFNDSDIVNGLVPLLEEADAVIGHYATRFDAPYVNTRAVVNDIPPPAPYTIIDTWATARSVHKLARNDLGSLTALYRTKHQKSHLDWKAWELARYGDKKSIDGLLKYNVNDVLSTEDVYLKMRPLMRHHPYVGNTDNGHSRCPACGGKTHQLRGSRRLKAYVVFRASCNSCGTWFELGRKKIP